MATITKTIGAAGDYATPAAAATAFNAGTVAGAVASDDIVFNIVDNAAFDSTFLITANPTGYASVKLTVDATVRHTGSAGTGARLAISTTVDTAILTIATLITTIEWLEIRATGAGKLSSAMSPPNYDAAGKFIVRNCIIHSNGAPTGSPFRAVAIGSSASNTGGIIANAEIHNNLIYNWKSGSSVVAIGIGAPVGGVQNVQVYNNTVFDIDVIGNTSGTACGIYASNSATPRWSNNAVAKIGTNTTTGTKGCYLGNGGSSVGTCNASDDTTAFGTINYQLLSYADAFVDADAGDFTPASASDLFQGGTDLGTSPTGVNFDLTGRNRDAELDIWSVGALQLGDVLPDSLTINTPVANRPYQRNGSNQASVTISGVGVSAGNEAIEYRFAGGAWTQLVAGLSAGTFSQAVTLSGSGTLEVRLAVSTGVTDSVANISITDIFLVAGQSNASGRLTSTQTYTHATLVPVVYDQDDTAFRTLIDPTDPETGNGSIWPLLATLIMADQGIAPAFITTADGGTSLIGDWKPTVTKGAKYNACVSLVGAASPNGIKAMIWDQGESDAIGGVSKADYNAALDALAANLQTDTGLTFPTICDLVGNGVAGLDPIRQAQIEAWDDNADIYPGANSITRASLHWVSNAEGATHAALLWVAMDEALYGGPSARGPRITAAESVAGTSTLRLTFDRNLMPSDTTYTSTAFLVDNDDGTARTVSSVARTGANHCTLTLSGPLDGTAPTVSFATGQTAASATVPRAEAIALPATIHGISSISVPADPIYDYAVTSIPPDSTAPVIATAVILSAGDTLDVTFTEVDSHPILPATNATGISLSSTGGAISIASATRKSDLVQSFILSRTVYSNEVLTLSYSQSTGNITDSAVPSVNEVPDTAGFAVTNSSLQAPTISNVTTDGIALVDVASTITWTSAGIIGNVDIMLSRDGGGTFPVTIVSGTANDGSYAWTPTSGQLTATGVVRVRSTADPSIYDDFIVKVATTSGGSGSNTALWFRLQSLAVNDGMELTRP